MVLSFLSTLLDFTKKVGTKFTETAPSRDSWRGVSELSDLPESLGSLVRFRSWDHIARVEALAQRLANLQNQERVELDLLARRWHHTDGVLGLWWRLLPSDVETLVDISPSGNPHLLGLASFHPSGRVREAALRQLGRMNSQEVLPYLLLRLNDWADPIVQHAQDLLPRVDTLQTGSSVLKHMDLVLKLQRATRRNHAPWIDHFLEFLAQPEQGDTLAQGLRSQSLLTRRLCFDLALKNGTLPGDALLEISQHDADPIIRMKVQRTVLSQAQPPELDRLVTMALQDPVPSCRRAALAWLEEVKAPAREARSREALLDRSRSVRDTARWILRQLGVLDIREIYLAAIQSDKQSLKIAAIQGLGEMGHLEDAILVRPFLRSPAPSLNQAALITLGRLDPTGHVAEFKEALASCNPRTSRIAAEILLQSGQWPPRPWLLDLFRSTPHEHVRRRVFTLVHKLPKWQGMAFFLDVMPLCPKEIDPILSFHQRRWLRSLLRVPPPRGAERESAKAYLRAARERLGWQALPEADGMLE